MKPHHQSSIQTLFSCTRAWLCATLLGAIGAVPVQTAAGESSIISPAGTIEGKSYGEWAAAWWQWALRQPVAANPLFDETGAYAHEGQSGSVFFIGGAMNISGDVNRSITIGPDQHLFFPILNGVSDNVGVDPTNSVEVLKQQVAAGLNTATNLFLQIDGQDFSNLQSYRQAYAPFSYWLPQTGNVYQFFGMDVSGTIEPAAADGYWIMLAPLPPGTHTVHFGGTIPGENPFTLDVTYEIAVTDRTPDLSRLVVIGDSLMAGYRDGGLVDAYQQSSIPAVIAQQAGVSLAQPLIGWPGINPVLQLVSAGPPPLIVPYAGTSTGRVDLTVQAMNLAVPGHTVSAALSARPDLPIDSMTDLVLGLPGLLGGISRSQVEWAEALAPSTILVWIGNNDALEAAIAGDTNALTDAAQFQTSYSTLVERLGALGATLVLADIPDVTVIPYIQPVPAVASMLGAPSALLVQVLGVTTNDYINLDGIAEAGRILQQQKAGPLEGRYVLTPAEIDAIRVRTGEFNSVIAAQAQAHGALVVHTAALLNQLFREGADIGIQHISTAYLGGILSLDGIHPTPSGAALTANAFIARLNAAGAQIAPVVWLTCRRDNGEIVLTWPVSTPSYHLEKSNGEKPMTWELVAATPRIVNGKNEVRLQPEQALAMFRLTAESKSN